MQAEEVYLPVRILSEQKQKRENEGEPIREYAFRARRPFFPYSMDFAPPSNKKCRHTERCAMHIGNLNPKGPIPPESAADKQNAATQASAGAKPSGSVPPAAKAVLITAAPTNKQVTPTAAVAAKPAAAVQPHPNTATPATQAVKGAATPGNGAAPSAPKLHQTSSTKGNKPPAAPPRIQLEKETKEQILAAIMEPPGEDDNSSLISIQPSQSEVNIDVQKKLQDSPVVKAFAEAEKRKSSQH